MPQDSTSPSVELACSTHPAGTRFFWVYEVFSVCFSMEVYWNGSTGKGTAATPPAPPQPGYKYKII